MEHAGISENVRCVDTLEMTFELEKKNTKVLFNKSSLLEKDIIIL